MKTAVGVLRIARAWAKHTLEKQSSNQTLSSGAANAEDASSDLEVLGPADPNEEENAAVQKALADAKKCSAAALLES